MVHSIIVYFEGSHVRIVKLYQTKHAPQDGYYSYFEKQCIPRWWFEPHRRHCIVSLSKTLYRLLRTGSIQSDPSRHDWKIVNWDIENQNIYKNTMMRCDVMLHLIWVYCVWLSHQKCIVTQHIAYSVENQQCNNSSKKLHTSCKLQLMLDILNPKYFFELPNWKNEVSCNGQFHKIGVYLVAYGSMYMKNNEKWKYSPTYFQKNI